MGFYIVIVAIMVFFKAIFAAGDTALTYIDREKLNSKIKKDSRAKKIKELKENRIGFWGEIELLIMMIELLATAFAAEAFVTPLRDAFDPLVDQGIISLRLATILAVVIVTFLLTYVFLIFGHILPKQLARSNPEKMAYKTVNILWILSRINKPFECLVRITTKVFSKIFRIPETTEYKLTEKELKMLIRESMSDGIIGKEEKAIILNTIKFDAIQVKDEMIKKEDVESINLNATHKEIIEAIKSHKFSRMPVYNETKDNIIGMFNMKDVITEDGFASEIKIQDYLRKIPKANKKDSLSATFRKLQKDNDMMALVMDDKEEIIGIITLEDIIERLVGEIQDENDRQ